MTLLDLLKGRREKKDTQDVNLAGLIDGYSIEVMPRTAAKIPSFKALLPEQTRVYIAHVDGTPIDDMILTARRLSDEGFHVMPHFPARSIPSIETLENWIKRYRDEAGVDQALLLGGGAPTPSGDILNSLQLVNSGFFGKYGFTRLHFAGHPEGNKDIDANGGTRLVDEALRLKQAFAENSDASVGIVTQFTFDAKPLIAWTERIARAGVRLPVHVGVAGPTKLQTLIKYAIACGVGPSLTVLQKRAMDLSKLLVPHDPSEVLSELATYKLANPNTLIDKIHVFPLGGVVASAEWMNDHAKR